jgi:HAD superfamily hydrolase (TIGR01549 family)
MWDRSLRRNAGLRPFRVEAVLFDFDGTLTEPGAIDFAAIRAALGVHEGQPILEFIAGLDDSLRREELLQILDGFETEAAAGSRPYGDAAAAVGAARALGLKVGILSRNSRRSIERALDNFDHLSMEDFDVVISREAPVEPKPHPDSVLYAARELGVPVERVLLVGDYLYDVQAGEAAGALTALLLPADPGRPEASPVVPEHWGVRPDFVIAKLSELEGVLRLGVSLPLGKLPNDLLAGYLASLSRRDPALLTPPAVGEDVAAVSVQGEALLVLKSDPITFASDRLARYALLINANDLATAGARPRWLLATWLFPPGSSASEVLACLFELAEMCEELGVTLGGGHTEITDSVTRPVFSGSLVGTAQNDALLGKANLSQGDRLLLTKAVAVEGTSVIAREFRRELLAAGLSSEAIEGAASFLDKLSILPEASLAADHGGVTAMHDVTEGGLATAVEELSQAGGQRIRVDLDAIPVYEETRRICRVFGLEPLGLIGSGSLLIAVRPERAGSLLVRLDEAGIPATEIGHVMEEGTGVEAVRRGAAAPWPRFATDELARLFARASAK